MTSPILLIASLIRLVMAERARSALDEECRSLAGHEAEHREKSALRRPQLRNEEEITVREPRHYRVRRPR
jgi:hypothetical protein